MKNSIYTYLSDLSLEDLDTEPAPEGVQEPFDPSLSTEPVVSELTASDDYVALVECDAQIDSHLNDIVELGVISKQLTEMGAKADVAVSNGGVSHADLTTAANAINAMAARYNVSVSIPETPVEGLKASMENGSLLVTYIRKTITAIWRAVVNAINELRRIAIRLFNSVFSVTARIERQARALQMRASKLEGRAPKKGVSLNNEMMYLQIGGELPTLVPAILTLNDINKHICGDYYQAARAQANQIMAFVKSIDPSNDISLKSTIGGVVAIHPIPLARADIQYTTRDLETDGMRTVEVMGGKAIGAERMIDGYTDKTFNRISDEQFHMQFELAKGVDKLVTVTAMDNTHPIDIEALDPPTILRVLASVITGCNIVQDFKQAFADRERLETALVAVGEAYQTRASNATGLSDSNIWLAAAALQLPKLAVENLDRPVTPWIAHVTKVYSALLSLCEKSIDAYQHS